MQELKSLKSLKLIDRIQADSDNRTLDLYEANKGNSLLIKKDGKSVYWYIQDKDYYRGEDNQEWVEFQIVNPCTLEMTFLTVIKDDDNELELWLETGKLKSGKDFTLDTEDLFEFEENGGVININKEEYIFSQAYWTYFREEADSEEIRTRNYEFIYDNKSLVFSINEYQSIIGYLSEEINPDNVQRLN